MDIISPRHPIIYTETIAIYICVRVPICSTNFMIVWFIGRFVSDGFMNKGRLL